MALGKSTTRRSGPVNTLVSGTSRSLASISISTASLALSTWRRRTADVEGVWLNAAGSKQAAASKSVQISVLGDLGTSTCADFIVIQRDCSSVISAEGLLRY